MSDQRETTKGTIFNIQRFSVQDGPGTRTIVFFKGCPLRCAWCCNPESQKEEPALLYYKQKCLRCLRCVQSCKKGAVSDGGGYPVFDREACEACGDCADQCYAGALELSGEEKTAGEVMEEVRRDGKFYSNSGGGVTLSGGEPLMQPEFAAAILSLCKDEGIHTAIETCGAAPWETMEAVLPYTDLFLYDIKHLDSKTHQDYTGSGNEQILENLVRLKKLGKPVVARLPVIPGCNARMEYIERVAKFLNETGVGEANVLPFHKLAVGKYESMGLKYQFEREDVIPDEDIERIADTLREAGLSVKVYGH